MKTGCPPVTAIWFAADHGVIRDGAPRKREDSPMAPYYVGLDVDGRFAPISSYQPAGLP